MTLPQGSGLQWQGPHKDFTLVLKSFRTRTNISGKCFLFSFTYPCHQLYRGLFVTMHLHSVTSLFSCVCLLWAFHKLKTISSEMPPCWITTCQSWDISIRTKHMFDLQCYSVWNRNNTHISDSFLCNIFLLQLARYAFLLTG